MILWIRWNLGLISVFQLYQLWYENKGAKVIEGVMDGLQSLKHAFNRWQPFTRWDDDFEWTE